MNARERERGSSIVEFAILGTLIFGVLIQTVVLFGVLHRATLATSAAAREYGRAIVVADSVDEARLRGSLVVEQATRNHGLPVGSLRATVDGQRVRGELLRVHVSTDVPVFRIPFVGDVLPAVSVPVEATHVVQIDRYRSGR
jgi:Flp pilus assembly protein TadG